MAGGGANPSGSQLCSAPQIGTARSALDTQRDLRQSGHGGTAMSATEEAWGWPAVERILQDLSYALRLLRKNPGWSSVTVATLALGIGATTTIFSILNDFLLRPLPFREAER